MINYILHTILYRHRHIEICMCILKSNNTHEIYILYTNYQEQWIHTIANCSFVSGTTEIVLGLDPTLSDLRLFALPKSVRVPPSPIELQMWLMLVERIVLDHFSRVCGTVKVFRGAKNISPHQRDWGQVCVCIWGVQHFKGPKSNCFWTPDHKQRSQGEDLQLL